ncbi:hypothetical protein PG984_006708 [Apiospora sp. TS-2023a]
MARNFRPNVNASFSTAATDHPGGTGARRHSTGTAREEEGNADRRLQQYRCTCFCLCSVLVINAGEPCDDCIYGIHA